MGARQQMQRQIFCWSGKMSNLYASVDFFAMGYEMATVILVTLVETNIDDRVRATLLS